MANIKTITKKLINNGYSENKLMMMTEKEIREAYKVAKEESTMTNEMIKIGRLMGIFVLACGFAINYLAKTIKYELTV